MSYWKILSMGWFILQPCSTWHRISLCESCTAPSELVRAHLLDTILIQGLLQIEILHIHRQFILLVRVTRTVWSKNCRSESNPRYSHLVTCGSSHIRSFRGRCESLKIIHSTTSLFHICFLPVLLLSLGWNMRFHISLKLLLTAVTGYYFFLRIFTHTPHPPPFLK